MLLPLIGFASAMAFMMYTRYLVDTKGYCITNGAAKQGVSEYSKTRYLLVMALAILVTMVLTGSPAALAVYLLSYLYAGSRSEPRKMVQSNIRQLQGNK
jgi:hypothetical protein